MDIVVLESTLIVRTIGKHDLSVTVFFTLYVLPLEGLTMQMYLCSKNHQAKPQRRLLPAYHPSNRPRK
jgi:hypothetical protein